MKGVLPEELAVVVGKALSGWLVRGEIFGGFDWRKPKRAERGIKI